MCHTYVASSESHCYGNRMWSCHTHGVNIIMWLTCYFDSHATAVECDTIFYNWCLYANTEYSWWLTCLSDNQPTFGARVKCYLIHMALFSTRNFSYRVHKQQFVLKRRASDVSFIVLIFHIISFIHSMVQVMKGENIT
jgi:hypothetical protein